MRAFAEKVFASETKDEDTREEISLFGVAECPILKHEMSHHVTMDDDLERRWGHLHLYDLTIHVGISLHIIW